MDLRVIEHHPQRVLEALRRGEFDGLEIIGEADEKDFFERVFRAKLLERLAVTLPGKPKKEEVPRWFILAGQMSLKLHQENSYLAFERVIRCGGLLSALPPELASKHIDPKTQSLVLTCRGFNKKNDYARTTPCDQDTLRKAARRAPARQWLDWFNGPVQSVFQADGFFDPAGVFVGDGSYLFVPDNPHYEGSSVLWFDEHNHPVEYEKLSCAGRKKAHRERCYKLVTLLHLRGTQPCYVYAAVAVVSGNTHELPVFSELLEGFVRTVGRGVVKQLLLDRAFLDGDRISHWKRDLGVDVVMPIKKNMVLLTYTLRQWQLWQMQQEQLANRSPDTLRFRLNLRREYVVIYHQDAYMQMPLVRFSRELLQLNEVARQKALRKVQHLEAAMLQPVDLWRNSS